MSSISSFISFIQCFQYFPNYPFVERNDKKSNPIIESLFIKLPLLFKLNVLNVEILELQKIIYHVIDTILYSTCVILDILGHLKLIALKLWNLNRNLIITVIVLYLVKYSVPNLPN